jgi:hypothetical protein
VQWCGGAVVERCNGRARPKVRARRSIYHAYLISLLNHGTNDATDRLPVWVTAVRLLECAMEPSWHDHLVQGLNVCGRDTPGHKACQRAGSIGDEAVDQAGATSRL